ncbi:trifunctional transcriptional regulator/proline dehydrogenase/L-glutamate gamma-semialdehyde dehydrogenase [Roseomonas sp. GC11]|uniref:trifunctional transcriptional regulator/proline dehydrogenase/L-glutamate gamma-semialdehyde dehydrogenase n=1 Tax=Roseomonas sp. GC11 TaxID=2950546 RepID=UPI00210CA028|nr:trifunctional transcriptional regulator/proline dehydrogenase/L-glutamate gamma-semialdehyde dehydrogenase [Roseomonas sp. GC11]MCQ4160635.1 trifunctional transcriptional regulator/proline dehydrogenase/L-glutamate gamma-semialdehyde dehydrogenase [Roseomonas sp. GC11]
MTFLSPAHPFGAFARAVNHPQPPLRAAITAATRRAETECLPPLLAAAALDPAREEAATALARRLVTALRAAGPGQGGGMERLVQEFPLSSQEGVALMCLAEALLRIPDTATRDALIRDKIGGGAWHAARGGGAPLFVHAAGWGLLLTGRLLSAQEEAGLGAALTRLLARAGEPAIRAGMAFAMRRMGEQFVTGQTIGEALARARPLEARGFRYSYDMLGEAAATAQDAARYLADYEAAIHAIGQAAAGRGILAGPGISVKLSALHPRYSRAQRGRVMAELLPRLIHLATLARRYEIGLNIDAEETDRLELSLDLLEGLCHAPGLAGWNGVGFVIQAYQRRAPYVVDYVIDLARRTGRRMMVRLVKGAYWDSEIKRAQADGQADFPVFTRKIHTDVSYLACARRLLAAPDAVFPQFATHNARTLAAIHELAGPEGYTPGQYEFQCLHGMGESLYSEVVGPEKLDRPCRIYAPVGTHETLLAYLVRRLLENGANSSFVNRIHDPAVPVEALVADPVAEARALHPHGLPHPRIAAPRALFGAERLNAAGAERLNSAGLDLADEDSLASLAATLRENAGPLHATPLPHEGGGTARPLPNPAVPEDFVGDVVEATPEVVQAALARAAAAAPGWAATPPAARADLLERAAALMEARLPALLGPILREAGKTLPNAVGEVREAVDFLRYYAVQARGLAGTRPLGPIACISPWNFPLAIFTGHVAAALAAGNTVLAKPAEETPLTASLATRLLHEAGVPEAVLQLLPGDGAVGAALVADARVEGVMFTGSTEVARLIQRQLAGRRGSRGHPVPLVAETGGQNALVVDSSALPEQVVADVLASAFDSAGQRCSALRILCLQEEGAERILAMLKGAMAELSVGDPALLSTDIGPVISAPAREGILAHIAAMRARGCAIHAAPLPADLPGGHFVAPTLVEIDDIAALPGEVFGPVLHVLRFRREAMPALMRAINATGYGLTFGVHSRLEATIGRLCAASGAGNLYVNRNMIGAVVGVQPFGGHGLSGTGPKAGGPLYLRRLLAEAPAAPALPPAPLPPAATALLGWLRARGETALAEACARQAEAARAGLEIELPGPVGERNLYRLEPRGRLLCHADSREALLLQLAACLSTGNQAVPDPAALAPLPPDLPASVTAGLAAPGAPCDAVLFSGGEAALLALQQAVAAQDGMIRPVLTARGGVYPVEMLLRERSLSINTAAAGGNAALMTL